MEKKIILSLLLIGSGIIQAQTKATFIIDGNILGLKNESKLCLVIKRFGKIDTVAKATSTNGAFKFKNLKLPVYPDFYLLCVQTEFVENLRLFLDQAGDIKINADLKKWPSASIVGSKTNDDFVKAKDVISKVWKEEFLKKYPGGAAPADSSMVYSVKTRLAVVRAMSDSPYIPAMIATWEHPARAAGYTVDPVVKESFYNRLSPTQKNSHYGRILQQQLSAYEDTKSWMVKLGQASANVKSISSDKLANQLQETVGKQIFVKHLPILIKHISKVELVATTKAATVILNMAYRKPKDTTAWSNPTSAYVIDENGICVTNYHVGAEYSSKMQYQSLSIMTSEGKVYPTTKILSCSESDDLMIFQVDTKGDKLTALTLGTAVAEGAAIHVMGHPKANFYRFTSGVISDYSTSTLAGKPCKIMNITADFNIGSSGGPIVDDYGNVVGTVSRISGSGEKIGIPVSELKKLIEFKK